MITVLAIYGIIMSFVLPVVGATLAMASRTARQEEMMILTGKQVFSDC